MQERKVFIRSKADVAKIKLDMSNFQRYFLSYLSNNRGEEFESAMLTTLQNNVPNKVTLSRYMVYIRLTVAFVRRNTSYTTEKKN